MTKKKTVKEILENQAGVGIDGRPRIPIKDALKEIAELLPKEKTGDPMHRFEICNCEWCWKDKEYNLSCKDHREALGL